MKHSKNNLNGRYALLRMDSDGDSASVIGYCDAVVGIDVNLNLRAIAGKCLVNRVVNYLIYKVMKSRRGGGTDLHSRTLAYRLKSFEYLYLVFVIFYVNFF